MTDNIRLKLPRFVVNAVVELNGSLVKKESCFWAPDIHEAFHDAVVFFSRSRTPVTILDVSRVDERLPEPDFVDIHISQQQIEALQARIERMSLES